MWSIEVISMLNGQVYARGIRENITIQAYKENIVSVPMTKYERNNDDEYEISIEAENGTATATPNPAKEGATVTITATSDTDFVFEKWETTSANVIFLPSETTNPATFIMPDEAVTIIAVFENISSRSFGPWQVNIAAGVTTEGQDIRYCIDLGYEHLFETRVAHPTGTVGLAYELIEDETSYNYNTYRVRKGTVTNGEVHIPEYHREDIDSDYLPVTEIGAASDYTTSGAFINTTISTIYISANIKIINRNAFLNVNINNVYFKTNSQLEVIGANAFNSTNIQELIIPASTKEIQTAAFRNCENLENVIFESNIQLKIITSMAFQYTNIQEIIIPASIKEIQSDAFNNCENLENVIFEINSQLEIIGRRAFGNTNIQEIIIPATVKTLSGFNNCSSLKTVNFETGSLLETIDSGTFGGCINLESIIIPEGVNYILGSAFSDCSKLEEIIIPANVTTIGGTSTNPDSTYAFRNCTSLKIVIFEYGSKIEIIGFGAFSGCASLEEVIIEGDSLKIISDYAFDASNSLIEIKIPADVEISATVQSERFTAFRTYYEVEDKAAGTYTWNSTSSLWEGPE